MTSLTGDNEGTVARSRVSVPCAESAGAYAAEEARFVLAFVRIGLVPDSGATRTLVRALGIALMGDEVADMAQRALTSGLPAEAQAEKTKKAS